MDIETREARLRAIAMNAIREARLTYERVDDPFSDDDALRTESIFHLLHVQEKVDAQYEHFPLTNKDQTASSKKVMQIANLLEQLDNDEEPQLQQLKVAAAATSNAKVKA